MAPKDYYKLLEIASSAPADEVKRAFRTQIARYHPDKVQHLGKEFQSMAADRAAELTEAYRVLSDDGRRADYDRAVATAVVEAPPAASASPPVAPFVPPPGPAAHQPDASAHRGHQFKREQAGRDMFVRKAVVQRIRQALDGLADYEEAEVRGFDLSFTPKPKLFGRSKSPRLLARFVSTVDPDAVADTWAQVIRAGLASGQAVCVFLLGSAMASPRELAGAIAEQRRRPFKGEKPILIPMDARNWDAHVPIDAPPIVKDLLVRLRSSR